MVGRLLSAHFLCYPLMFVGAAAGMSLAIVLQKDALMAAGLADAPTTAFQRWLVTNVSLSAGDAAVFELVITPCAWVLGAIFMLSHAVSLPWALAARRRALGQASADDVRRARKLWIIAVLGATGAVVVAGLCGWAIILFRS